MQGGSAWLSAWTASVGSRSQQGTRVESVCGWTCGGLVDDVSSRGEGSGMRGRLGWCGVQWLFQGCCLGGRLRHRAAAAWRAGGFVSGLQSPRLWEWFVGIDLGVFPRVSVG